MPAHRADITPFEQAFVREWRLQGKKNGAKAALAAGSKSKTPWIIAAQTLARPRVQALIAQGEEKLQKKFDINLEKIIQELACLGFANAQDYYDEAGNPIRNLRELTREQAAAIQEFNVEQEIDEDGTATRRTRIKLADKRSALVDLGRHFGLKSGNQLDSPATLNNFAITVNLRSLEGEKDDVVTVENGSVRLPARKR